MCVFYQIKFLCTINILYNSVIAYFVSVTEIVFHAVHSYNFRAERRNNEYFLNNFENKLNNKKHVV